MNHRILIFCLFLLNCILVRSQDQEIGQVLTELEDRYSVKFYYEPTWFDSTTISLNWDASSLEETLLQIEKDASIYFYRIDDKIIITKKSRIIDKPAIANYLNQVDGNQSNVAKGLIFEREYLNLQEAEENRVYEIGVKENLVPNGTSTVAGYIREQSTGDAIEGALVYIENPFQSTVTDENGFYSITLPNGRQNLIVQFVGMQPVTRQLVLFSNGSLNIDMDVEIIALQEVTVAADAEQNVESVQMGVEKINIESVKNVPVLLGEKDILKVATTLPGVQQVGEGASGFNVRGGKADQNLFIINNSPVYNTSHFFGFFSVFNSDAVQNMELFKSSIPAHYGGRLSSVFDIQIKQANNQKFSGKGSISPITSALTLEIPLVKEKTSLLVGGRTTYSNWVLQRVSNDQFSENRVAFNDVVVQLDHQIREDDHITLSVYRSSDQFRLLSDTLFSFSDFRYTNENASLKWQHNYGPNLDHEIHLAYSQYKYDLTFDESIPNSFEQDFDINNWILGAKFNYYLGDFHQITAGFEGVNHQINPGTKRPLSGESLIVPLEIEGEQGFESALYVSDEYSISNNLTFYGGLRYAIFNSYGPRTSFIYREGSPKNIDSKIDSIAYGDGEIIQTYHGPEFRLSGRYTLNQTSSIKFGFNRTQQFIHTLTNSASVSPTDIWRLSSEHIRPQKADNFSLGYYRNFLGNQIETSIEGYYRKLHDILDFKVGADFLLNPNIETAVLQGDGKSYGLEFSVKKSGDLNGWVNYTFSRTFIRLDGEAAEERINNGAFYPTNYDRPHNLNIVTNYKLTRRFSLSMNINYTSGRPVTYPIATYNFKGTQNIHYSDRNAFRIPDYFRMDVGLNIEGNHKIKKLAHSFWSLSIYNLTSRDNPYSVFFDVQDGKVNGYQLVVFGNAIPTIGYNFRF